MEPRASWVLGKNCETELCPRPKVMPVFSSGDVSVRGCDIEKQSPRVQLQLLPSAGCVM
jgi:hypothetical protein